MIFVVTYLALQKVPFSNYEGMNIKIYEVGDSKFIEDYYAKRKDIDLQVIGHSSKNYMYSNYVLLWKLWRIVVLDAFMSILHMSCILKQIG
jgi:hypothetical protein